MWSTTEESDEVPNIVHIPHAQDENETRATPEAVSFQTSQVREMLSRYSQTQSKASQSQPAKQIMASILSQCSILDNLQNKFKTRKNTIESQIASMKTSAKETSQLASTIPGCVQHEQVLQEQGGTPTLYQRDQIPDQLVQSSDESTHSDVTTFSEAMMQNKKPSKYKYLNYDSTTDKSFLSKTASVLSAETNYFSLQAEDVDSHDRSMSDSLGQPQDDDSLVLSTNVHPDQFQDRQEAPQSMGEQTLP